MITPSLPNMLDAARLLGQVGLAVVPIPLGKKGPRLKKATAGNHRHRGAHHLVQSVDTNIGIATGSKSKCPCARH